jgi:hypothetical protein
MPAEQPIHFYNVITGKIACGAKVESNKTVFSALATCPECRKAIAGREKTNEERSTSGSGD